MAELLQTNYLSPKYEERLKTPKSYKCEDHSTLSNLLASYWNAVADLVPPYVAPNALTIGGASLVAIAYALMFLEYLFYPFDGPRSSLLQLVCALSIWLFQTADAIDGKQARKTGSCSVLGDFVDHATDMLSMNLSIMATFLSLGMFNNGIMGFILSCTSMQMVAIHLEASVTGILVLPDFSSITEAQIVVILLQLTAYFFPSFYSIDIGTLLTGSPLSSFDVLELRYMIPAIIVGAFSFHGFLSSLRAITNKMKETKDYSPLYQLSTPLITIVLMMLHHFADDQTVVGTPLRYTIYMWAFLFINITIGTKLVIWRICGQAVSPIDYVMLSPLLVMALNLFVALPIDPLIPCALAALAFYAHYYICVCQQIAKSTNVYVFTLGKRK